MRSSRRWLLIGLGLPAYTALLMVVATVLAAGLIDPADIGNAAGELFGDPAGNPTWWWWCGGPVLVVVAAQAVFVIPIVRLPIATASRGRSVLAALVVAALVAAGLSVGLFAAILELFDLWLSWLHERPAELPYWGGLFMLPVFIASWLIWTVIFLAFTRRRRDPGVLGRIAGLLLAGTVVEVLAVIPVDVMVRRRGDCYCATGTFHSLLIAAFAAMWLAGPGVAVLYVRRRRRMAARRCVRCGYAKGPDPGPACPECGYEWTRDL